MGAKRMGSDALIDPTEAGQLLGVTREHVHHLVRSGMLRPRYAKERGRQAPMRFHREEVAALVETREKKTYDLQKIAGQAAQAFAMARQLERRVELLENFLGRMTWPLETDEESVVALYARAQDAQQEPDTSIAGVMDWARTFIAMGDEYLDLTEAFTGDENCWKVFKDLSDIMIFAVPRDRINFDRELEAAYGYLDVGRRHLQTMSFFYIRNRFGNHVAKELLDVESCHEEVLSLATAIW